MGAVYEVTDETVDKRRALKIMLPGALDDPDLRRRFVLEMKVTGRIESDHIVENTHSGVDDETGHLFLVMELLRGEELGRMVRQRKGLPPSEALVYLRQLAFALDKTHAADIVHRDLKPDNLFVTARDDGSPCLKILDFGIAKVLETQEANSTRPLGTPLYMAPEQARGKGIGPASDRYAFGQIAYTMLVGESYWGADAAEGGAESLLMRKYLGAEEPASVRALRRKNVTLPKAFDEWFFRATAVKPEDRFESGRAAIEALAAALDFPVRAAMPSVLDGAELITASATQAPGVVIRTAPLPAGAIPYEQALGDTNRPTLPIPQRAPVIQPHGEASNADGPTIVVPGSASGPLGATNMTATSRTWVKPLQGRSGLLAAALVGVIVVVGVVGYVVKDGGAGEKAAASAGSVAVVASSAPVTVGSVHVKAPIVPAAPATASQPVPIITTPVADTAQPQASSPTSKSKSTTKQRPRLR